MKRIVLAAAVPVLLLVPAAGAESGRPGRPAVMQHQREIVVRGTVLAVSPISVRASSGGVVTCHVRDRELVARLSIGDRVKMKCDGRWVLRRLAISAAPPTTEPSREVVRAAPPLPGPPTRAGGG